MPPRTRSRRAAIVARSRWCRSFIPSSRKACLRCEGVSHLRPDSILESWHLSVHPRCLDAVAEAEIRLWKDEFARTGESMRGDSNVRDELSRRIAPYCRVRYRADA